MNIYTIFCLITASGMCGGIAYALSIDNTYSLRLPFAEKNFDTGVLGHGFIGSLAALVGLPIADYILKLELFVKTPTLTSTQLALYIFAIGIVAGFSGLRVISEVSKAIESKLRHQGEQLDEQQNKIKKSESILLSVEKIAVESLFESHMATAKERFRLGHYNAAMEQIEVALDISRASRALIVKANILRKQNKFKEALDQVVEAIEIGFNEKIDEAIAYWNKACYKTLIGGENLSEDKKESIMKDIERSILAIPEYKADIKDEEDFAFIKDEVLSRFGDRE